MSFEHAAVTKGLMMGSALTSILVGLFDVKHYLHLQLVPHISRHHQYWRLAVHHLGFSNSTDLFLSEIILFNVAIQVERQFGSIKFASFAIVTLLLVTILEFLALLLFHRLGLNYIALGPAGLLFAILHQYHRIVPSIYHYRIFGLPLTNKSFTYVLALQLAISRPPGSLTVAIAGLIAGALYRSDVFNFKSYRVPPSFIRFSTNYLLPLVGSTSGGRRTNRALPASESSNNNDATATSTGRAPPTVTRTAVNGEAEGPTAISTAAPTSGLRTRTGVETGNDQQESNEASPSVMREWVNELTGRAAQASVGIRVPAEGEITTLTTMFPNVERDVLVAALQRR
ncbi:hypothetical protein AX16_001895 [Volvariella volvacea WC 439]|nr:hypothetical protein AX16_001895 [Volvariella volvacea WC 439]